MCACKSFNSNFFRKVKSDKKLVSEKKNLSKKYMFF